MGCFNVACSVSKISIGCGTDIVYIPLEVSRYPYKIGDGNNMLIYSHCFYSPVTLPIFGKYDDYGGIEDIIQNENVKHIEDYFKCKIEDIVGIHNQPKPISSGMFIHRKIYDFMIHSDIDEWGGSGELKAELGPKYDKFRKQLIDSRKQSGEYNDYVKETDISFSIYSFIDSWSFFNFDEYKTFQKIYRPSVEKGLFRGELIDFILFIMSMCSTNSFYFPATNGCQSGNYFASRDLYKTALKIAKHEIKEGKESFSSKWWTVKYRTKKFLKKIVRRK